MIRFALPKIDAPLNSLLGRCTEASGRDLRIEISTTRPTADLAHVTRWAIDLALTRRADGRERDARGRLPPFGGGGHVNGIGLLWRSIRAENRLFWRTPIGAFFTIGLPLVMLVLFVALFGNDPIGTTYGEIATAQFYAAGLGVFAAASATYNLAINVTMRRDDGVLKRVRGTHPAGVFLAAIILSGMWIAAFATALMVGVGILVYGVDVELAQVPAMIVAFLAGTACFATLGLALASVAKTSASAPAIANATIFPRLHVECVRAARGSTPVAHRYRRCLPAQAVCSGIHRSDVTVHHGTGVAWDRIGVMLAWT